MAAPIPHETLARAVRAAFGAEASIVTARALFGDASSRRYVRLELRGGGAPATVVAALLGAERFSRGSDELGASAEGELPFINVGRYLAARGFPVPTVHHDAARAEQLLLLEDVGDQTLWAAAVAAPREAGPLFEAAVDLLVALQVAGAREPDPACYAFRRRFDTTLAQAELEHFVDHGIETRRGAPLPPAERARMLADLAPLVEPFETPSPVLAHRDFMAWNLHVQEGRLRLIDFQDALLAPEAYDLAALLTDRTTGNLISPRLEAELSARFCRARAAGGFPVPGDVAGLAARYRTCALHRALKVIGRFHFLECVQGKPGYLAYLPAVYAVARRMFTELPALEPVRTRIATYVPELGAETT